MRLILSLFIISISFSQTYTAAKLKHNVKLDGIVESEWEAYNKISKFYQRWPNFGAESQVKSEVFFAYDEENVYVAGRFYQEANSVKGTRYRRDVMEMWSEDWVQLNFDPFNQGSSGFYLGLNPANALIDGKLGPNGQEDHSWDGIILTQTKIHDDHWSFEIQIPLSSIDFQNEDVQDWKITFGRSHSGLQEQSWAHQMNKDDQIRLTTYMTFTDMENLRIGEPYKVTPYIYGDVLNDQLNDESKTDGKVGIEVRYQPNPATKIIATVNPDFAQLESDADVINVSDDPTNFPEKRPFFTTNSEFYNPAPAVNSRNIGEIDFGAKFIQDFGKIKYDLTYVRDRNEDNWFMGNGIYDDSKFLQLELVGGIREANDRTYLNGVFKWQLSFLDRKMTLFSYNEYNNVVDNSFGVFTGLNYRTRNFQFNSRLNYKPDDYNTANVGYYLESNKFNFTNNFRYTVHNDANTGFIRSMTYGLDVDRFALDSHRDESWFNLNFRYNLQMLMSKKLGTWGAWTRYTPAMEQKFRNRVESGKFKDTNFFASTNYFNLVERKNDRFEIGFNTDQSRMISGRFEYNTDDVRQAKGELFETSLKLKASESIQLEYTLQYLDVDSSSYQEKREDIIHRFKATYSLTDRFNIRAIYSLTDQEKPYLEEFDDDDNSTGKVGYVFENPVFNITAAWEYQAGSFAYLVFNQARAAEAYQSSAKDYEKFNSIILKINKSFQF